MNNIDLKDKIAVVTGGAQGFGLAIVERLLKSQAKILIWDKDKEMMDSVNLDDNVKGIEVDIINYNSVEEATKKSIEIFGGIDILVNNAGIAGPNHKSCDYPLVDWQAVIDIDLGGVFHCCKAIVPHMIEKNYGRIVNISSIAGKEGNPNASAYSSAKAGVIALTKSLAKELADKNIAVNCVTPAAAKTRIFDQMSQEHIDYMLSKIPRNRFVKMEEMGSLVSWMVSEENSFTTGAVFDLSGGRATY
jgi:3-oxoacyl-[acyl-carrier protein] reductase